jgi:hypothetical protein
MGEMRGASSQRAGVARRHLDSTSPAAALRLGADHHDRADHEKFMPQETAALRNIGRFTQAHPLLLRLMIREVRASVHRAPTSTLQPRDDASR